MAWRCDVKTARGAWVALDEGWNRSKAAYERGVRKLYPMLRTREYRIVETDTPKPKALFTLSVPI